MTNRDRPNLFPGVGASQQPRGVRGENGQPQAASESAPTTLARKESQVSQLNATYDRQNPLLPPESEASPRRRRNFLWLAKWQLWGAIVVLISGTAGFFATTALLKLPTLPSCPKLYLPMASASMRLYCAQLAADKQTLEGLLDAIALVDALPSDHPMREEINRNIELWSLDILDLAEEKFHAGKLEEAIAVARKISIHADAYQSIDERIAKWQKIWKQGETIAAAVEKLLDDSKWPQAFRAAAKLVSVKNKYWSTTQYKKLYQRIGLAQEESRKLDKAYAALRRENADSLLKAIELAEQIEPTSSAYREAQKLIADAGEKLLKLAKRKLEQGSWSTVMKIANRIPAGLDLQQQMKDLNDLAMAGSKAEIGTVSSLEEAIQEAQIVPPGRELYGKAQQLIGRWRLEIQDVNNLAQAEELARSGGFNYLSAAIAQAQLIPRSNPRYQEAQAKIREWTRQIQRSEDQPILDRASEYARSGGEGLQRAVEEVSTISPDRALYREAQRKSRQWQSTLERNEDQPYLDRARELANAGNLGQAIEVANNIRSGRALYSEAQGNIRRWRNEIQGQANLQQAVEIASGGTPDALASAIRKARQVPQSSTAYTQSTQAVEGWSQRLLNQAQERSAVNLNEAIAIARKIPAGTSAYQAARSQIEVWQQRLEPRLPETAPILDDPAVPSPAE